jgi:hypothetical protein
MIKQKPVYICDSCEVEMVKPAIRTEDVPYEGFSQIILGKNSYPVVEGLHYCSIECLFTDIKKHLTK